MNSTKAIAKLLELQTHPTQVTMTITEPSGDKVSTRGWAVQLLPSVIAQPGYKYTIKK